MPRTAGRRRGRGFVGSLVVAGLLAPVAAQAQGDASDCFYRLGHAGTVGAPASVTIDLRTAAAERGVALQELALGQPWSAIARLERTLSAPEAAGSGAALAPVRATLATAYDRVGCRAAAAVAAERALADGYAGPDAARLRQRLIAAKSVDADSLAGADVGAPDAVIDPVRATLDSAWASYKGGRFVDAAAAFARAADATPAAADRYAVRLLQAQALLESNASARAISVFQAARDSARALAGAIEGRVAAGAPLALGRAAVGARQMVVAWGADARTGRLLASDASGAGTVRVGAGAIRGAMTGLGASAADPVAAALAWAPAGAGMAALRAMADTLRHADARVARATALVARVTTERPARLAAATARVALVRRFADTLAAAQAQLTAYADSIARHDAAIAKTIADYRALILGKVDEARRLAAENRRRIDSIAPAARRTGEVTTRFLEAESGTATEYLAVAEAAADALERALPKLGIVLQRDTVHTKHERLRLALDSARAGHADALNAALAAERDATAAADADAAAAQAERRAAVAWQAEVVDRAAAAFAAALGSRAPALKSSLESIVASAIYGTAASQFFAAIEVDTTRAAVGEVTRRRDAAIGALTDAVGITPGVAALRPSALLELAELLTRKADADFAAAQRAGGVSADHPDYAAAIVRYEELLKAFPNDSRADAAAYTLGTLAFMSQRYDDANRAFARVVEREGSPYRTEAYFRQGDGRFEQGSKLTGDARRAAFAGAAEAYAGAIRLAQPTSDIYFLSLYKLGWSNYMQAERQSSDEYRRAVDVFVRLVREVDALPAERQSRLALRQEAIDYLAIAITQLGGPEEAVRDLGAITDLGTRMLVLRRVAHALRDQGEFASAVVAFRGALDQAPTHPNVLETRAELVDLYQSRMIEPARAQEARLELIASLAPGGPWAAANVARAADLAALRERTLREAGSYALTVARNSAGIRRATAAVPGTAATAGAKAPRQDVATTPEGQAAFTAAADLLAQYLREFPAADSARRMSALEADARFGARDWFVSGAAYSRTATRWPADSTLASMARRNAVAAFDSALATERRATTRDAARLKTYEDSLFGATERFVAMASPDEARAALVALGRRASEAQRWDVVASAFSRVAETAALGAPAPGGVGPAEAHKIVGDAEFKRGRYAAAQVEWRRAQDAAAQGGRKALLDSIVSVRIAAAVQVADSLAKRGAYVEAADSVLGGLVPDIADPTRAADVLRNVIEVHLAADSTLRVAGDSAASRAERSRAIRAIETLADKYPKYQHTLTYAALRARLLADVGRPADAAAALTALAQANATWPGRADAMVRAAVLLDSIGQPAEAAAAYERFSTAFPGDKRAADAQFNAGVILSDAKDPAGAARAYKAFIARYPRDSRVARANLARWDALKLAGDSTALNIELGTLCAGWKPPTTAAAATPYTPVCADRAGAAAFKQAMASWDAYAALKLEIKSRAQLTRDGVALASQPKQALLRTMTAAFQRAIASTAPDWVAAATFQSGLAQWHYGLFLRDVVLPADLTDAQRTGALTGSAQQAQQYFDAGLKLWQALVEKATADKFENQWVTKARAAIAGEGIPARERQP